MFCQCSAVSGEKMIFYLRTATLVGPETVLTAILAAGVVLTLVVVDTESSSLVQLEAPGTDTAETSLSVLAGSRGGTESLLLLETLVNIQAAVPVLLVSRPAHTDITPLRVDTVLLAVVLLLRIVINHHTPLKYLDDLPWHTRQCPDMSGRLC